VNTSSSRADDASDSVLQSAVSKVKRHILPLFVIMFIVNYIDRVKIGFVRSHMEHDLGIGAAAYGFGAGLFFIAYALFEVPSNILLQKVGARIWLTRIMLTWGLVAAGMAFIQTETHFYILRFLLGVAGVVLEDDDVASEVRAVGAAEVEQHVVVTSDRDNLHLGDDGGAAGILCVHG
jgi:MFS family permease